MYNIEIASPMMFYTNRLATFTNWTFKSGNCTAEHMAHAGFYLIQDDCTKCVFCYKELDGWEVTDYPWDEHKSHKPDCPFVQLNKRDLTTCHIDEFIVLNSAVVKNKMVSSFYSISLFLKKCIVDMVDVGYGGWCFESKSRHQI
jgi:Inhibitor of Apoptosis domain.